MIDYGIKPFDICEEQPVLWKYCKCWFVFTYLFSTFLIANVTFHLLCKISFSFFKPFKKGTNKNSLVKKEKHSLSLIDFPLSPPKLQLLIR